MMMSAGWVKRYSSIQYTVMMSAGWVKRHMLKEKHRNFLTVLVGRIKGRREAEWV
jgi:hypothetical protein